MPDPIKIVDHKDAFKHVDTWVFDLDNTLYPASSSLFPQIHVKMTRFVADTLGMSDVDAKAMQRKYYFDHGTTLNGMMIHHDINPADFLSFVHDIDHSVLDVNHSLRESIEALPGKKLIFTNGTVKHATDTLKAVGLSDLFDDMFDIIMAGYDPKPDAIAYNRFFSHTGLDPKSAAMFEDMHHNLRVPHETGMRTVLITDDTHPDAAEHPEVLETDQPHVQFVTSDLAQFLKPLGAGS